LPVSADNSKHQNSPPNRHHPTKTTNCYLSTQRSRPCSMNLPRNPLQNLSWRLFPPPQRPIPTQQDMQDDWKEVKIADMTPLLTRVQNPAPEFKPVPVKPNRPEVEKPAPVLIAPTKTTEVKPSITEVVPPPKTQTEQVKKKKHPAFDYDSDQEF
jgi:hypothetical protein